MLRPNVGKIQNEFLTNSYLKKFKLEPARAQFVQPCAEQVAGGIIELYINY